MTPAMVGVYNIPLVLAQAMEKAGSIHDTEKLAKVLREGEWDVDWTAQLGKAHFVGAKMFGLNSVLEQALYLSKVVAGKVTTFQVGKATFP